MSSLILFNVSGVRGAGNERAFAALPIKRYGAPLQDSGPPTVRIIGRNCFAMRWSDKRKSMIFQRLCRPSPAPSHALLLGCMREELSSANWVMADCWSVHLWCFFSVAFFFFPVDVNETSKKWQMFFNELGWSWILGEDTWWRVYVYQYAYLWWWSKHAR